MIPSESLLRWLTDFHLASAVLLAAGLLAMRLLRQPAYRIAVAWAACGAIALAGVLYATPGWSSVSLLTAWAEAPAPTPIPETPVPPPHAFPPVQLANSMPSTPPTGEVVPPVRAARARGYSLSLPDVLALTAVSGGACVLAWLTIGSLSARRLVADGRAAGDALDSIARELWDTGALPRLLLHDRLGSPVALNLLRPVVLLPARLRDASTAVLRPLLAHELAHVRNGDLWLLAALRTLMVVLWANPLFWLLRRAVRFNQEQLADAAAAGEGDRLAYAEQLVEWARSSARPPRVAGAVGLWEGRSQVKRRVAALLDSGVTVLSACGVRWRCASAATCVALGVGVSLLTMAPPSAADEQAEQAAEEQDDSNGLTYRGTVVNKDNGEPIAGAEVLVRLRTSSQDPWPLLDETTYRSGEDGRYEFTITPERLADKYLYIEVEATHPDYARKSPSGYALSMIRKNQKLGEEPFFSRIELHPGERISGKLLRPDGSPAAAVRVLIYSKAQPRDLQEYGSFADTKTDDQGRFTLNVCRGGPAVLWFLPQDLAPETHLLEASSADEGEPEGAEQERLLKLTGEQTDLGQFSLSAGLRMRGRVLDQEGAPAPGVWVNAELRSGPAKKPIQMPVADCIDRSALTNEQGEFIMAPLPPGGYEVVPAERPAENPDRTREERPLPATFLVQQVELNDKAGAEPIELRATETVHFHTQNLDSDGKPTRGHGYSLVGYATEDRQGFFALHPNPDANGEIEIDVPKGAWHVEVRFMTNEHGALRVRTKQGGPLSGNPELKFDRLTEDIGPIEVVKYTAPILLVRARDPEGGDLEGLQCEIHYSNEAAGTASTYTRGHDVHMEIQGDGAWRTSQLLPDEPFGLSVTAPGYGVVKKQYELKEGETKEVEIVLPAVAEDGREEPPAEDAGQPDNAAASFEDGESMAVTGALRALPDPGYAATRPGEANTIEVNCTRADGDPVKGAQVVLYRFRPDGKGAEQVGTMETDAEGRCRWANVVPAEDVPEESTGSGPTPLVYVVTVRAPGLASEESMMDARTIASEGQRIDLSMQKGAVLRGEVVNEAGRAVSGARVSMDQPRVPGLAEIRSATTDDRGQFAIDDLHARDYAAQRARQADQQAAALESGQDVLFVEMEQRLEVSHPDFAVGLAPVDRVPSSMDITLQPAAVITGRVVDDAGRPVAGVAVVLQTHRADAEGAVFLPPPRHRHAMVRTNADGEFECRELPPGAYTVRADLGNWEESLPPRIAAAAVVVDAQSTTEPNRTPDLLVTKGRVITVQLVDAESGEPLRTEQPMRAVTRFQPDGSDHFGLGQRSVEISKQGRFQLRVTDEAGRLMLANLGPNRDWSGVAEWAPGAAVPAAAGEADDPVSYPVARRELTVEERVSEAMRFDLHGDRGEAIKRLNVLAEESPNSWSVVWAKARLDQDAGRYADAIAGWGKSIAMPALPKYPALNNLAHLLASAPQQELRDGRRAIELSQQALAEIDALMPEERGHSPSRDAVVSEVLDTLAAAYAEVGEFDRAVETQQRAIELANPRELPKLRERLELYQRREPYRMKQ
ncbi:Regulatory protein BlaR1 [Posidoniimonas polymericola]|uniref:Regulatory protein BlaR1 n=1 Tax=Posidoniimonas polymericola TaxID=2528002 RepID=A0A5C5YIC4_9BACT|nr:M56 family metallopeptidase [Posidoniimonas polymericola]TWT74609.1 Regulatory protein BlaR1 [Posidoniimonas polymericola]